MDTALIFIAAVIGLFIIGKLFAWPIKILMKLIVNGILGGILLLLINFVGGPFGIYIAINAVTALIAGLLGIPGVLFLIIFNLMV
ncbi:pro-sigmaK processing inhibitor BofA family protein [Clostridium senegalense]|uniref:pro-sigmaK processing inhibitor BofA family protein n=1 Tax=Clostridium senegalense TaxID=1465809 RepID=UPI00028A01C4|nr:pro-sigmaK processing inhibitor BofA family protein [Clostridium senegalense]MBU5228289.1 pro-sigmaK processing inhibitor BofA family protein [Clostridium senegalense]